MQAVRGERHLQIRRQVSVRSRVQRVAQPRPPPQIQDRAVPHVSHDRFLPVRAPLPFHPQLRGGTDPQSESERPAGFHPAQHNKPEPVVERGCGRGRGRRWKRVQRIQRELEQQRLVARADRRLPPGDGDRRRGHHPQPDENQLVEPVQLGQRVQPTAIAQNQLVELDDQPTPPPPPPPSPLSPSLSPLSTSSSLPPTPSPAIVPPPAARPPSPQGPAVSIPVTTIKPAQALEAAKVQLPPDDYTREITGTRTEQRVKMNRMRMRIAERLKEAQNTNAMLTTFNEIDMSRIMEFRKLHQENFTKKYGLKLGFMSPFIAASAYALKDQPVVNAVIDGAEIVYRDYVDISVAVATPKGLVVPVLRSVENKNFAEIEIALAALSDKARKGKITVEDMDGGTFTISNGGVFGSLMGTPIINPPQSSILGMHGVFDRPIAIKGEIVIRPMMYVALTYDHRLIDGREAVMFLRKIKAAVEDPRIILAGL